MFANEEQIKAIELMAQNEECVAQLYRVYADKFPEVSDIWKKIAQEEDGHAKILRDFILGVKKGELVSRNHVFSVAVRHSIAKIKNFIAEAREKNISLKEALAVAESLEASLLEKEYFRVVASDSSEFKSGIVRLVQDTERHQSLFKEMQSKQS